MFMLTSARRQFGILFLKLFEDARGKAVVDGLHTVPAASCTCPLRQDAFATELGLNSQLRDRNSSALYKLVRKGLGPLAQLFRNELFKDFIEGGSRTDAEVTEQRLSAFHFPFCFSFVIARSESEVRRS